ncbi:hypothetical protein ACFL0A_01440 [Patescibacteria group bacterium]
MEDKVIYIEGSCGGTLQIFYLPGKEIYINATIGSLEAQVVLLIQGNKNTTSALFQLPGAIERDDQGQKPTALEKHIDCMACREVDRYNLLQVCILPYRDQIKVKVRGYNREGKPSTEEIEISVIDRPNTILAFYELVKAMNQDNEALQSLEISTRPTVRPGEMVVKQI